MRTPKTTLIAATTLLVLLTVACAPTPLPTPSPTSLSSTSTPTPTPTSSTPQPIAAPTSEADAIAAATETIAQYMELRSAIYADPAGSHDISTLVIGPAADRIRDEAAQLVELGIHTEGEFQFEATGGVASEAVVGGTSVPFGRVTLTGCYDSTGVDAFDADGRPAEVATDRRVLFEPVVVYRPSSASWLVYDTPDPSPVQPC